MFTKLDEIPSMPVQDIKKKPKWRGQRITKGNNSKELAPSPYIHLVGINVFAKFYDCLFKILKNQNVADGRNKGRTDNVKTVYGGFNYNMQHSQEPAACLQIHKITVQRNG